VIHFTGKPPGQGRSGTPWKNLAMSLRVLHGLPLLIYVVVAANLLLAGWAFVANIRKHHALPRSFWTVLLLALVVLVVQVAAGITLTAAGSRPRAALHILYGILVGGTAVVQFGLRPGGFLRAAIVREPATFRESRLLALICLTQAALILRAYTTGAFGR
jgi:hypothetical protein